MVNAITTFAANNQQSPQWEPMQHSQDTSQQTNNNHRNEQCNTDREVAWKPRNTQYDWRCQHKECPNHFNMCYGRDGRATICNYCATPKPGRNDATTEQPTMLTSYQISDPAAVFLRMTKDNMTRTQCQENRTNPTIGAVTSRIVPPQIMPTIREQLLGQNPAANNKDVEVINLPHNKQQPNKVNEGLDNVTTLTGSCHNKHTKAPKSMASTDMEHIAMQHSHTKVQTNQGIGHVPTTPDLQWYLDNPQHQADLFRKATD